MDIDALIGGAIRLSSFVTVRLIFFVGIAVLVAPYFGYSDTDFEDVSFSLPLLQELIAQYQAIVQALGIEAIAVYLLFFVFISTLHFIYEIAVGLGAMLPISVRTEKLQNLERRFSRRVVAKLLEVETSKETIGAFTSACQSCIEALDTQILARVQQVETYLDALKTYIVAFLMLAVVAPAPNMMSDITENAVLILMSLIGFAWFALRLNVYYREQQYDEMAEELEDCAEKHLRPSVSNTSYTEVSEICDQIRREFRWQADWVLPIVGSLRNIMEARVKRR